MTLLNNEEKRLEAASRTATRDRAARIAETIDLAVAEVKNGLMDSLANLPEENLSQELALWEKGSQLVCNAFTCSRDGVVLPLSKDAGDLEVLKRNGAYAWELDSKAQPEAQSAQSQMAVAGHPKSAVQNLKEKSAWDAKLAAIRKKQPQYDWIYNESPKGLRLAAWYRPYANAGVRAVEVSVNSLLADLKASFPPRPYPTEVFHLVDNKNRIVHQSDLRFASKKAPDFILPIGSQLPGWRVQAYHLWQNSSGSNLFLIGSAIVILLAAVAIAGGLLLLRQSRHDAQLALRKTTFVSNVSHELKTPLTSIRMYAEMLEDGRVNEPSRVAKYLRVIVTESQRLTRLVNNVLDFSRLEQGRKEFYPEVRDIIPVIENALESQRIALEKTGMIVQRDYDSKQKIEATADDDALEAVLVNLIDNAVKYAAVGKRLRIEVEHAASVRIRVIDNGPGVPPNQVEAIFDRFHRVKDALTDQSGTGLGLSIARKLSRGMGGDLRYCHERQEGGCFEIILPAPDVT